MATFHLQIVTPDKKCFDGMAQRVLVRTTEGDVCILAGHIDYAAALGIGEARVTDENGNVRKAACSGGMISVGPDMVRVIATTFEWADEINADRAEAAREKAESKLRAAQDKQSQKMAEYKLKRALNRIAVQK